MMRMMPVLAALDADEDGEISSSEIENAVAALKKLDTNGDGKLTEEEVRPNFGGGPGGRGQRGGFGNPEDFAQRFTEYDKNKDNKLTKDEIPERMANFISRLDTNQDEVIDKAEWTEWGNRMQQRGGRGARGGFGGRGGRGGPDGAGGPGGAGGGRRGGTQRPQRPE